MEEMLQVGVVATTHGVRGEMKIFPTTDTAQRFLDLSYVYLDTGRQDFQKLEIQGVKFFKKFAILKFQGIDDMNEAEKYKGKSVWIPREEAQPLGEDEYYIGDLIGMDVVLEDETPFGTLKDVMQTGANDVYVVKMTDGREALLPAIWGMHPPGGCGGGRYDHSSDGRSAVINKRGRERCGSCFDFIS